MSSLGKYLEIDEWLLGARRAINAEWVLNEMSFFFFFLGG